MAVQRMNDMGTENASLRDELSSLTERIQPLEDQSSALQQELNSLRESCTTSSYEDMRPVNELNNRISQISLQLENERR